MTEHDLEAEEAILLTIAYLSSGFSASKPFLDPNQEIAFVEILRDECAHVAHGDGEHIYSVIYDWLDPYFDVELAHTAQDYLRILCDTWQRRLAIHDAQW